jgi:phosphopantothenate synthetase
MSSTASLNIDRLKKMMKHIQTSLKGGSNPLKHKSKETKTNELQEGGSSYKIYDYMKYYLDMVFDRENFLKKEREDKLNGIREPFDKTAQTFAEITPVDTISPATAIQEFVKSVEEKKEEDERDKQIAELPENIQKKAEVLDTANKETQEFIEKMNQLKQGILDDLQKVIEPIDLQQSKDDETTETTETTETKDNETETTELFINKSDLLK